MWEKESGEIFAWWDRLVFEYLESFYLAEFHCSVVAFQYLPVFFLLCFLCLLIMVCKNVAKKTIGMPVDQNCRGQLLYFLFYPEV